MKLFNLKVRYSAEEVHIHGIYKQWIFLLVKLTFHLITPWGKYLHRCKIGLFVRMWRLLLSLQPPSVATCHLEEDQQQSRWLVQFPNSTDLLILVSYLHVNKPTDQRYKSAIAGGGQSETSAGETSSCLFNQIYNKLAPAWQCVSQCTAVRVGMVE